MRLLKDILEGFIEITEHPFIAGLLLSIFLIVVGLFKFGTWSLLFSIILTYFVADLLASLLIGGGHGAVHIPIISNLIQERGHAYLSFIVSIIGGTLLSELLSDIVTTMLSTSPEKMMIIVGASILIVFLSYLDFHLRYVE